MSERTLGQIAYEGFYARFPTFSGVLKQWTGSSEEIHARWEAAANAVIEECANVADRHWITLPKPLRDKKAAQATSDSISEGIRALKSQNASTEQAPEASPRS